MSSIATAEFENEVSHITELRKRIKLVHSIDATKKNHDLELELKLWDLGQLNHLRFCIIIFVTCMSNVLWVNVFEIFAMKDGALNCTIGHGQHDAREPEIISRIYELTLPGLIVGAIIAAFTLDISGRVVVSRVAMLVCAVFIALAFVDSTELFYVSYFFITATGTVVTQACFSLLMDYCSQQSMCFAGLLFYSFGGVTFILLGTGVLIFDENYLYQHIMWALIILLEFLAIFFCLPESIRLNLGHGNNYHAWQIMSKLMNEPIPGDIKPNEPVPWYKEIAKRYRLMFEIFTTFEFVKRAILFCVITFFVNPSLFLKRQQISRFSLPDSTFAVRQIVLGFCEFFIYLSVYPLFFIFGRKLGIAIIYCVSTILVVALIFLDDGQAQNVVIFLSLVMDQTATAAIFLMISESFPTNTRAFMLSLTTLTSFVGTLVCSLIDKMWIADFNFENDTFNIVMNVIPILLISMIPPTRKRLIVNNLEEAKRHYIEKRRENTGPYSVTRWFK